MTTPPGAPASEPGPESLSDDVFGSAPSPTAGSDPAASSVASAGPASASGTGPASASGTGPASASVPSSSPAGPTPDASRPSPGTPRPAVQPTATPPGSRRTALVAGGVAALLALGGGGWWAFSERSRRAALDSAEAYATQVAAAVAKGEVPPAVDVGGQDAQSLTARILEGMGKLRHDVTTGPTTLDDARERGTITLRHTWTIHEGKAPWEYTTTMPIVRDGDTWKGQWAPTLIAPDLRPGEGLRAQRKNAVRGEILGDGGAVLVTSRPVVRVGIDKGAATNTAAAVAAAEKLARLVGVDAGALAKSVSAAGPKAFVEAIVLRKDAPQLAALTPELNRMSEVARINDTLALPPATNFARPILGSVGPATAEIIAKSGGAVREGDVIGLSGVQAAAEKTLGGRSGFTVQAYPYPVGTGRTVFSVEPVAGQPVSVTLNSTWQAAADATLATVGPASAIVAVRASDGHVLAAASGPGGKGYSTATLGRYAPGSTFKAVTALALLRGGVTPSTVTPCPETLTVGGRTFRNHSGYPPALQGPIPFAKAFAHSCNTAMIGQRDKLGADGLGGAAASLGLTATPSLGIGSTLGAVPSGGDEVAKAAAVIGQGAVVASPLGMATVAASIAKGGTVSPQLLLAPGPATPTPSMPPTATNSAVTGAVPLTPTETTSLQGLLRGVVTEGTATLLAAVPGGPVMAKTGTAEYGNATPPKTHAWMIAAQNGVGIAVFVEDGEGGAATAGPLLKNFLTRVNS